MQYKDSIEVYRASDLRAIDWPRLLRLRNKKIRVAPDAVWRPPIQELIENELNRYIDEGCGCTLARAWALTVLGVAVIIGMVAPTGVGLTILIGGFVLAIISGLVGQHVSRTLVLREINQLISKLCKEEVN